MTALICRFERGFSDGDSGHDICYTSCVVFCSKKEEACSVEQSCTKEKPPWGYFSKMLQQLPVGGQVDVFLLQRLDQKLVVPAGCGQDISPDDEVFPHFRRFFL